eukprot:m.3233 g.3233  ORF g.3233 m.3233 type:complete len:185 (+) comp2279_c0_seq1:520-1074(+)
MDVNGLDLPAKFDRVCSIEMFEHMKNYQKLLSRVANCLKPGGKLFVHIFVHRHHPYHFDTGEDGPENFMARTFFSGGTMPSEHLLYYFQDDLRIEKHWAVNGKHYERTLNDWLKRHDKAKAQVLEIFTKCYGSASDARLWFNRWRLFYIACAEFFGYNDGNEWFVCHYRFVKPNPSRKISTASL